MEVLGPRAGLPSGWEQASLATLEVSPKGLQPWWEVGQQITVSKGGLAETQFVSTKVLGGKEINKDSNSNDNNLPWQLKTYFRLGPEWGWKLKIQKYGLISSKNNTTK